jgi:hypothetical protein
MRRGRRLRRRRNSPYGATSAEQRHLGWNPRGRIARPSAKRGQRSGASGVLLGTLDELVVEVNGRSKTASKHALKGLFLAWMPDQHNFAIVKRANAKPGRISAAALNVHRQFHNSEPRSAAAYHAPDRDGSERDVGLITSLTYVIPSWMYSPEKAGFKWVHLFGDHGEAGHGSFRGGKRYAHTFKPMLRTNGSGGLFIKRRPGNKYNVTNWIFW